MYKLIFRYNKKYIQIMYKQVLYIQILIKIYSNVQYSIRRDISIRYKEYVQTMFRYCICKELLLTNLFAEGGAIR